MGKRNASKYIELVKELEAKSFMGRNPTRPPGPPIAETSGWAAFKHRYAQKDNRLWVPVKIVHVAALGTPKRRGTRRTFWLYWGIDEARFRRSQDHRLFQETAPPDVYAAVRDACATRFTVERYIAVAGDADYREQRAKLKASTAKRAEHDARRYEEAHQAALEEDALWRRLYGGDDDTVP